MQQEETTRQAKEWLNSVEKSKKAALEELGQSVERYRKVGLSFEKTTTTTTATTEAEGEAGREVDMLRYVCCRAKQKGVVARRRFV